ncbi:translation initiation factor IF-2-like isoform X2 [Panthera pardus]|uniref:Translation initiation factor IF-2-like isoform X2 n=1 Tax=Panthera pardus TaxID=9691 RepID=A0A9W2V3I4_PANPR|nr:translation initiation factor IF-2-like isoform X2 [Panthera pardus]
MGTFLAPGALSLRSRRPCWRFGHREAPGAPGYLLPPPASSPRRPRPPRLTGRVRGGSGSAAFTPAEEAPAAPWSPAPLPLPLARLLSVRSLPLANFRVLRSTRNRGDPQQVLLAQRSPRAQSQARRGRGEEDLASPPLPPPPHPHLTYGNGPKLAGAAAGGPRPQPPRRPWRKQGRRQLGKKWSRNGKIQTHPLQMVSRCKLRCFRAFPRARPLPPARAPPRTHSLAHTRAHTRTPGRGPGRREYSMQPPHNK